MKPFAERTKRAQVESLHKTALAAATEFGLQGTPRLVFHGFNTTFRFATPEGEYRGEAQPLPRPRSVRHLAYG